MNLYSNALVNFVKLVYHYHRLSLCQPSAVEDSDSSDSDSESDTSSSSASSVSESSSEEEMDPVPRPWWFFLVKIGYPAWLWLTVRHGIDGPFIDGLPGFTELNSMVIFHGKLLVITRG